MLYLQSLIKKTSTLSLIGALAMPFGAEASPREDVIELLQKHHIPDAETIVDQKRIKCIQKNLEIYFAFNAKKDKIPLWQSDSYQEVKEGGYQFQDVNSAKATYSIPIRDFEQYVELRLSANGSGTGYTMNRLPRDPEVSQFVRDMRAVQCLMNVVDKNSGCQPCEKRESLSRRAIRVYQFQA